MDVLMILFVPVLIAVISFILFRSITFKEFLVYLVAVLSIGGIISACIYMSAISFTEIWNGKVVKKYSEKVPCSHSYSCRCRSYKCGKSTCTHCDTCYEHSYDVDWNVEDNTGYEWEVERIDRRGLQEPERFTKVQIGEATSHLHSYDNYLKASKSSVYKEKFANTYKPEDLPQYPNNIFDYYKLDRLVDMTNTIPQEAHWKFIQMNGEFGKKECNAILVVVKNQPFEFAEALYMFWGGGNKNDAILIININDSNAITWVESYAMTESSIFQVSLKDDIKKLKDFNVDKVLDVYSYNIMNRYQRMEMKNFEYLKYNVEPSFTALVVALVFGIGFSLAAAYFFHKNDLFGEE